MTPLSLDCLEDGQDLRADLVIVGGGACGLTLAKALSGRGLDILVLESGLLGHSAPHEALNRVEAGPDDLSASERAFRKRYHGDLARDWREADQPYGLRSRGLGGATRYWAGKCAPLDPIDYTARDWLGLPGWPIAPEELAPYIARAEAHLALGPACYDADLWARLGKAAPEPLLDADSFSTIFWQFARSPRAPAEVYRFGDEALADPPEGVRVLLDATVTEIVSEGQAVTGVRVKGLSGRAITVRTRACVLAASAIENARLLLASDGENPTGLGNGQDQVGRCLMDHPTAVIGRYPPEWTEAMTRRFGFFTLKSGRSTHLYMHGLRLSEVRQKTEGLLNGAVFMLEKRVPDDPVSALARLLRRSSEDPRRDLRYLLGSPSRWGRSLGIRLVESNRLPRALSQRMVDLVLWLDPNRAATDMRFGPAGRQMGVQVEAISEQAPDPENRVSLSQTRDALGQRLPQVRWQAGDAARANLLRLANLVQDSFAAAGLPVPEPEDWVREARADKATVIDMGHSMGTTRMSDTPATGVVDRDCKVHGVAGLWVAGGSVMPTGGHANPTLMMLALALRLADHLAVKLRSP